ncbi:MAG: TonB-dependent receptor [Methylotenera sp.]|nr:TonB-dependent receptor [Methylotenera sp.]MDO9232070.1 TonB-dependent receptor [Methylotenera sp.]MDO9388008.1 TonB-dependent receptor [Methylotenera sp.]MDP2402807.1 TonB-dependent receptor [Methylotenera sp.]MDP3094649.1 TonB-dependent receptor [Methylotenera sp.]
MRFKKRVIASLLPLVFAQLAYAADPQSIELKAVTVTGILPDKLESVPGSFSVVDEKELEARRPFSIKEALNTVPGVHIVTGEDSMSLGLNIGVRGLDPRRSSRTLLMEDGVPLFLAPYGDPAAHFSTPLQRLQRIEVVKGSGQILYGPQTIGGMINFVTKPVPKDGFAGSVQAMAGNNDFTGLHANVGYGGERGGIMIDALQNKGDGVRDNHDFDMQEFTIKGQLNLTDRQTLIAKVGHYEEDSHVTETGLGVVEYNEDRFQAPTGKNDVFKHKRQSAQLQHIFQIDDTTKLSTQAYYVDTERASFRQINDSGTLGGRSVMDRCEGLGVATEANAEQCGGRWRPREYTYWGVEPRLDFQHNLFGIKSDAVVGFRYHKEDIERNQFRGADPRFQSQSYAESFFGVNGGTGHRELVDIEVEAKSYYAQNTFNIGNWALTPGVRVEDLTIKTDVKRAEGQPQNNAASNLTNNQTEVLPGFGVAWNGIQNTTVFAGVHKGFAPPRPDRDIFATGANNAVVSKVKPETSTNWEIGVRSKYFKGISFESTLFHTAFDDIVVEANGSFFNGGESEQTGVELAGRVDFGTIYDTSHNVYLMGSYTNLFNAEFKKDGPKPGLNGDGITDGGRLPYAPRHLASLNIGYQHPIGLDARFGVDYVSEQQPDAFARALAAGNLTGLSGNIPAYTLLNASVNFKPVGSKATYFLSAHNLADKEYLVSRRDGMFAGRERQIFGGIRYDF